MQKKAEQLAATIRSRAQCLSLASILCAASSPCVTLCVSSSHTQPLGVSPSGRLTLWPSHPWPSRQVPAESHSSGQSAAVESGGWFKGSATADGYQPVSQSAEEEEEEEEEEHPYSANIAGTLDYYNGLEPGKPLNH